MSRTNQILILILVLEIALVAVVFIQKQNSVVAPVPSAASIDSITASDLSELAGACNTAEEWHSLANIYMSAGFFAEADVCFREAIELRPEWGDAIFNYGFCLSRFGQTSEANLQFQKVVDLSHSKSSEAAISWTGLSSGGAAGTCRNSFPVGDALADGPLRARQIVLPAGEI
jgi:tetratricopeptide (TPR) repeat protein